MRAEVAATVAVTAEHAGKAIRRGQLLLHRGTLRRRLAAETANLGEVALTAGMGDPSLRSQLAQLEVRMHSVRAANGPTKTLEDERRGLVLRIAESFASADTPPAGLAAAHAAVRRTRAELAGVERSAAATAKDLLPATAGGKLRLAAGVALPLLGLVFLGHLALGGKPATNATITDDVSVHDIRPVVGTPAAKPLPPEYRTLAQALSQGLKSDRNDFRDDKGTTDIVAEGHAAILDLRAVRSSDADIGYIAAQGAAAYNEAVGRMERLNALPKPPSAASLFVESFVHGLFDNAYAAYALGADADAKQKAVADEITGLIAAVEKADAAHLLLPRVAERYAATTSAARGRVVVDFDGAWNAWGPHDWLSLYNAGDDLVDCTVVVDLKGAVGQARRNVHFVKRWAGKTWLHARYAPDTTFGDRRVGGTTVADVTAVGVRVLSPQFSTEVAYTYAGAERAKDVARRIAEVKPHLTCRVRDSGWGASSGKVVVLDNRLRHAVYKIGVRVVAANGALVGEFVKERLDTGGSMDVGSWQVSRNLVAGDRVTVYVGDGELLQYTVR